MSTNTWNDDTMVIDVPRVCALIECAPKHLKDRRRGGVTVVELDGRAPAWLKAAITTAHRRRSSLPLSDVHAIARDALSSSAYWASVNYPVGADEIDLAVEYALQALPMPGGLTTRQWDTRRAIATSIITSAYRAAGAISVAEDMARCERAIERSMARARRERWAAIKWGVAA